MNNAKFGSCCNELHEAMATPPTSMFHVDEDDGVLYLKVGYAPANSGTSWFEQPVIFCPFCGTMIQDEVEVQRRAA